MILTPSEEKGILIAAKRGDLGAFEKILYLYERAIFNYVYRLVRNNDDAEDLTQETFIKFYYHLDSLNPEKGFRAWIYKVATNTVYDFWRKKMSKAEFAVDNPEDFETIDPSSPYLNIDHIEKVEDIETALSKIKPIYKTVLLLFYQQGFSYEEIAEIISAPLNTVKTYLYRAKKELKKVWDKKL